MMSSRCPVRRPSPVPSRHVPKLRDGTWTFIYKGLMPSQRKTRPVLMGRQNPLFFAVFDAVPPSPSKEGGVALGRNAPFDGLEYVNMITESRIERLSRLAGIDPEDSAIDATIQPLRRSPDHRVTTSDGAPVVPMETVLLREVERTAHAHEAALEDLRRWRLSHDHAE